LVASPSSAQPTDPCASYLTGYWAGTVTMDQLEALPSATAAIEALGTDPDNLTFNGTGNCYVVTNGIELTAANNGAIIEGGGYLDVQLGTSLKPIFRVEDANNIKFEDLTVDGLNQTGQYKSGSVGQAGIETRASVGVTITDVAANYTWGDGLEMTDDPSSPATKMTPSSDIVVNGFTALNPGRDGISPSAVTNAYLFNIDLTNPGLYAIDFESDIAGLGSGNVAFENVSLAGIVDMVEALTGPIIFDAVDWQGTGRVLVNAEPGTDSTTYPDPIYFIDSSFFCARGAQVNCLEFQSNAPGSGDVPPIWGGPVYVQDSQISYAGGTHQISEPVYGAQGGVQVNFTGTKFIGVPIPPGSQDSISQVNIDNPPPTTGMTSPASGATLSGTVTLTAGATASAGLTITKVEYYLENGNADEDGLVATATSSAGGWAAAWDTTSVRNNVSYNLISVAYDSAGNSSVSAVLPIQVHN
jgi:hypothetical protein